MRVYGNGQDARIGHVSRATLVVTAVLAVSTGALMPVATVQESPADSFMPALIATVTVFDVMSAYLLLGDFRDRGDRRSLVMALAYVWSLMVMTGYALAFPGALFADPPLGLTASTAPYLYLAWHCGFPVFLAMAWAPWPARFSRPVAGSNRPRLTVVCVVSASAAGAIAVTFLCLCAKQLPVLIIGLDTSRMTALTAPVVVPLVALALVVTVHGTWGRAGPERWTPVAVLACLCDLSLTYTAHSRFSVGWYGGRTLTIFSAGVVLLAMLASFRRLKAQAERDALTDSLTGLVNRRGAYAALETVVARSQRAPTRLGVVSFDLDWFKTVNDQDGHEAGDAVLAQVGVVLGSHTRGGDVGARVGGEEFLLLLHDADPEDALAAAERLRDAIAAMIVPGVRTRLTASMGVTSLSPEDTDAAAVLRRADVALYEAKHSGRDRVASCFAERTARAVVLA